VQVIHVIMNFCQFNIYQITFKYLMTIVHTRFGFIDQIVILICISLYRFGNGAFLVCLEALFKVLLVL